MVWFRSILFTLGFWLWIAFIGLIGLPFCLAYRNASYQIARWWAGGTLWMLRVCCGITFQVEGLKHLPSGAFLLASKHQSAWDTVIFWHLLRAPAYVMKRELIVLPVFGWYLLLLRNIYIDRKGGSASLKKMLREASRLSAEGRPIVIFPEGTRHAPGESAVYHPGVAALYQHLQIPCVPVSLNSGHFWPKSSLLRRPGVIRLAILPPIPPGLKSRAFLRQLQETIEMEVARLTRQSL